MAGAPGPKDRSGIVRAGDSAGRLAKRMPAFSLAACLIAAGCAETHYTPSIDLQGADRAAYNYDLGVCRRNSEREVSAPLTFGLAVGAGVLLGGLIGLLNAEYLDDIEDGYNTGAAIGGGAGVAAGGVIVYAMHARNIDRCMRARGYKVLD